MYTHEGPPLVNGVLKTHDEVKEPPKSEETTKVETQSETPAVAEVDIKKAEHDPSLSGLPHELRVQIMQHVSDLKSF